MAARRRAARSSRRASRAARALGERIRELLLDGPEMTPWAEAALFAAARAELVERGDPAGARARRRVVCDRYVDSSLAYQGIARGLGLERVLELNLTAIGGLLPDLTFVLLLDPEAALARARRRAATGSSARAHDFLARVDAATASSRSASRSASSSLDGALPPRTSSRSEIQW